MTIDIRLHFSKICLELQNPFTMLQINVKIWNDLVPYTISNQAITINISILKLRDSNEVQPSIYISLGPNFSNQTFVTLIYINSHEVFFYFFELQMMNEVTDKS